MYMRKVNGRVLKYMGHNLGADMWADCGLSTVYQQWLCAQRDDDEFLPTAITDTTTPRTAESSAVKTRKCHDLMCENMVEGNVGTYCGCNRPTTDDVDNTVTQRDERYGLFADGAKYERTLVGLCGTHVKTDVYRVLDAFNTGDPILDHLIKKALCAGSRGHKDKLTDYRNIVESAEKALKLLEQKQNGN